MRHGTTLQRQLAILRGSLPQVAVAVVLAALVAFLASNMLPRVYEARATLLVGQALAPNAPDLDQLLASQRLTQTYAEMVTMRPLMTEVIDDLDLQTTPEQLASRVTSQSSSGSLFLSITVDDSDPAMAATIANHFAAALVEASPSVLLDPSPSGRTNLLRIVEPAIEPSASIAPRVLMNTLLAAVVTLILVVTLAFILDYLDDRLRSPDSVGDAAPEVPILGMLTGEEVEQASGQLTIMARRSSRLAAAYQDIRTHLGFARPGTDLRSLVVAGESSSIGTAELAANLAIAFAQAGSKTIVIDADVRDPKLHGLFRQPNDSGLTTLLADSTATLEQVGRSSAAIPGLVVIAAGPTQTPSALMFRPDEIGRVLQTLRDEADVLIVRAPSLPDLGETAILAAATDGTLLVIQGGRTTRQDLLQVVESLRRTGAPLLGFVYVQAGDATSWFRARRRSAVQPSARRRET